MIYHRHTPPNKALEPTRVGALSSAVTVHVSLFRVAQLGRYVNGDGFGAVR